MKGDLGYSGLRPSTALYLLYKWPRLLGKHSTSTKEVLFQEREMGTTPMLNERAWDTAGLESGPRTQTESLRALKWLTAGLETATACEPQISTKSLGGQQCGQLTSKGVHGKDTGKALHFNVNEGVSFQCNAR